MGLCRLQRLYKRYVYKRTQLPVPNSMVNQIWGAYPAACGYLLASSRNRPCYHIMQERRG